jgi:hypothetical protein
LSLFGYFDQFLVKINMINFFAITGSVLSEKFIPLLSVCPSLPRYIQSVVGSIRIATTHTYIFATKAFFVVATYADSMLAQVNTRQPEVAFCLLSGATLRQ